MNIVIASKDIVRGFRESLMSMENMDWSMEELVNLAVDILHTAGAMYIASTDTVSEAVKKQLNFEVGQHLSEISTITNLNDSDREVLRLSLIEFSGALYQRFMRYGLLNQTYTRLTFKCLVDDDIVVTATFPLVKPSDHVRSDP